MKRITQFFIAFISFTTLTFAQDNNCKKTCTINKTVYEDAFLGVQFGNRCQRDIEKGVIIMKVIENTAAEENLLEAYDTVLSINDVKVSKTNEAVKIIKNFNPFDTIDLEIHRDGNTFTKTITLGAKTTKIVEKEICCEETVPFLNKDNISVFPNPAISVLNINFKAAVQEDYKFGIYMTNGVLVKEYDKRLDRGGLEETIPVNMLEDGVYVLKIVSKQATFSQLFVVKKE